MTINHNKKPLTKKMKKENEKKKREAEKLANQLPPYEFTYRPLEIPQSDEPISSYIESRMKNNPEHQEPLFYLANQHMQRIIGYKPPLQVEDQNVRCINSTYISNAEKRRQFEKASDVRQKEKLMDKYGIKDHKELMRDVHYERELLRNGLKQLSFVHPVAPVTARTKELAAKFKFPRKENNTSEADPSELSARQTKKLQKMKAAALKRNAKELKKKKREQNEAKEQAPTPVKQNVPSEEGLSSNLSAKTVEKALKKSKDSVKQLKEKLKTQLDKKKHIDQLQKEGKDDEAQKLKSEDGWDLASRKAAGEKVETYTSITRNLDRAIKKKKNSGVALKEALDRQDQAKHKKLIKKGQNVRERRVSKQASKLVKLEKRGRVIPGFA